MNTINVELSPGQRKFVEAKVVSGGYSSEADYLAALVSDAQRQEAGEKLRAMLQEGEDSGPPVLMTRDEWDKVWREANEEFARRNGHG
jgi:antitoxin ParD1/3/4